MRTTFNAARHADYLGADPSDRYAKSCRPIEVCGLSLQADGSLSAEFWQWLWPTPGTPLDVGALLAEINAARATLVDGPQALASPGMPMRVAERPRACEEIERRREAVSRCSRQGALRKKWGSLVS